MATSYLAAAAQQIINLLGPSPYTNLFCRTFLYSGPSINQATGNVYGKMLGVKWSLPANWQSRNVPAFIIDLPSEERVTGRNVARTFTNAVSAYGDVNINDDATLLFRIIYANTDRVLPANIDEYMKGVLLADPTLGLKSGAGPIIRVSGAMTCTVRDENTEESGGQLRTVARYRFPMTFLYNRATLNAMAAFAG